MSYTIVTCFRSLNCTNSTNQNLNNYWRCLCLITVLDFELCHWSGLNCWTNLCIYIVCITWLPHILSNAQHLIVAMACNCENYVPKVAKPMIELLTFLSVHLETLPPPVFDHLLCCPSLVLGLCCLSISILANTGGGKGLGCESRTLALFQYQVKLPSWSDCN